MTVYRSKLFLKHYVRLPEALQKKVDRQIMCLCQNLRHPSVRAKKLEGTADVWEARVDYHVRMTFHIDADALVFRDLGTHAIYKKR